MPIMAAYGLASIADEAKLGLEDRIRRDLYWIYQVANSLGRHVLEPLLVEHLAAGSRHVLAHQRFALSMPMRSAPVIQAAIDAIEQKGIRAAPQLIEAAAGSAGVDIPERWRKFLGLLGGGERFEREIKPQSE